MEEPFNLRRPRGFAFLAALTLLACGDKRPPAAVSTPPTPTPGSATSGSADVAHSERRFVTPTGKVWMLRETKRSASLSIVSVRGTGFPNSQESVDLGEGDPLEATYLTDLDGDGWSELLIVRRGVGSGSYADLAGLASNSDLSFGPIHIAKPEPRDPLFAGYRGHDTLRVEGHCLLRAFPVYGDQDPNTQPSGGTRELCYRLEHGEGGFVLVPQLARSAAP